MGFTNERAWLEFIMDLAKENLAVGCDGLQRYGLVNLTLHNKLGFDEERVASKITLSQFHDTAHCISLPRHPRHDMCIML
jgi:hypothetical protein